MKKSKKIFLFAAASIIILVFIVVIAIILANSGKNSTDESSQGAESPKIEEKTKKIGVDCMPPIDEYTQKCLENDECYCETY